MKKQESPRQYLKKRKKDMATWWQVSQWDKFNQQCLRGEIDMIPRLQMEESVLLKQALIAVNKTEEINELKIMKRINKLLKEKKVDYDLNRKRLIWIYYPKIFKRLLKRTKNAK